MIIPVEHVVNLGQNVQVRCHAPIGGNLNVVDGDGDARGGGHGAGLGLLMLSSE